MRKLKNIDDFMLNEAAMKFFQELVDEAVADADKWLNMTGFEESDDREDWVEQDIDKFFEKYTSATDREFISKNRDEIITAVVKQLEHDFKLEPVTEAYVPRKAAVKFEISKNLKAVTKMEKALIDMGQMITEMNDDIMKLNFNDLDATSIGLLNDMRSILKAMNLSLKKSAKTWTEAGLMQNSQRLRKRLQELKEGVVLKR